MRPLLSSQERFLVEQYAGIHDSTRVERVLRSAKDFAELVGPLSLVPAEMVSTNGVVMRDRGAETAQQVARGDLDLVPHPDFPAPFRGRDHGEIRRYSIRVDMCDAGRDDARLAAHLRRRGPHAVPDGVAHGHGGVP